MSDVSLDDLKTRIQALAVSAVKFGLPISRLLSDYRNSFGADIPLARFGFSNVTDLVRSLSSVVYMQQDGKEMLIYPVNDRNVAHITQLALKAKTTKLGCVTMPAKPATLAPSRSAPVRTVPPPKSVPRPSAVGPAPNSKPAPARMSASFVPSNVVPRPPNRSMPVKKGGGPYPLENTAAYRECLQQFPSDSVKEMEEVHAKIIRLFERGAFPRGLKSQDLPMIYQQTYNANISPSKPFKCSTWEEVFLLKPFKQYFEFQRISRSDIIVCLKATPTNVPVRQLPWSSYETSGKENLPPRMPTPILNQAAVSVTFRMQPPAMFSGTQPPVPSRCPIWLPNQAWRPSTANTCGMPPVTQASDVTTPVESSEGMVPFLNAVEQSALARFIACRTPNCDVRSLDLIYRVLMGHQATTKMYIGALQSIKDRRAEGLPLLKCDRIPLAFANASDCYHKAVQLENCNLSFCRNDSDKVFQVKMTRYFSPHSFVLRLAQYEFESRKLLQSLSKVQPETMVPISVEDCACGMPCLCYQVDDDVQWARGLIKSVFHGPTVKVYLVDCGVTVQLAVNRVFYLPRKLFDIPVSTVIARLALVKPSSSFNWDESVRQIFEKAFQHRVWAEVMDVDKTETWSVILTYETNGEECHINDMLLKTGKAAFDPEYLSARFLMMVNILSGAPPGFPPLQSINEERFQKQNSLSIKNLHVVLQNMGILDEGETNLRNLDMDNGKHILQDILQCIVKESKAADFPFEELGSFITLLENRKNAIEELSARNPSNGADKDDLHLVEEIYRTLKHVVDMKNNKVFENENEQN